jgi:hypothetical protein
VCRRVDGPPRGPLLSSCGGSWCDVNVWVSGINRDDPGIESHEFDLIRKQSASNPISIRAVETPGIEEVPLSISKPNSYGSWDCQRMRSAKTTTWRAMSMSPYRGYIGSIVAWLLYNITFLARSGISYSTGWSCIMLRNTLMTDSQTVLKVRVSLFCPRNPLENRCLAA